MHFKVINLTSSAFRYNVDLLIYLQMHFINLVLSIPLNVGCPSIVT